MRVNPIRAFDDLRAKSVGGRSIRKRSATTSAIAFPSIIALRNSLFPEQETLARLPCEQRLSACEKEYNGYCLKNSRKSPGTLPSQQFLRKILQDSQVRTILRGLRTIVCARVPSTLCT
jgi:hypothetical protein